MPVNGSHGACPCSGGSSSQRAAGGRARRSRRHRGALSRALDLLLPFSKKQSSGGTRTSSPSQRCCRQEKYLGKAFSAYLGILEGS